MTAPTVATFRDAVADPTVQARYWAKVRIDDARDCWWWTGAVSGNGHGRFWLAERVVVIAHRYGWALIHGAEAALRVPVLAHACDNAICQNHAHLTPTTPAENRRQWAARRHQPGNPARDLRGARRRARELRDAAASGADLAPVIAAGVSVVDAGQQRLW